MSDAPPLWGIRIPLRGIGSASDPPFSSYRKKRTPHSHRAASETRLKRREEASKQSECRTAKNGFLENIRDRERLRPAGSHDSHKFWAEESSGLYAFFRSVSSIGKNGIIKAKDFSQLRKSLSDRKNSGRASRNYGIRKPQQPDL